LGRQWQCGTIQVDYQLPSADRLNAEYIGEDNAKHHPVMLHRAVLGSLERFIGILLENFAGALPVWLAPEQAVVIPVAPAFNEYAEKVAATLKAAKIRAQVDATEQRMNAKIRNAQGQKIPYMFIIGDKEAAEGKASIRLRTGQQMNGLALDEAVKFVLDKIAAKAEI
ncbi:MAG: threonine--tRNA ligase, partial [Spirochaetia bacterium]|nr:threonine--tRNA ligase [Spirochaetia bacterium]